MVIRASACLLGLIFGVFACIGQAQAAALRIAPILVDVPRGATSTIELNNLEDRPAKIQIRIFRWSQKDGKNVLLPTRDVVASPPFANIKPGGRFKVRIVRLSKRPVSGEESYRLLIDQIPQRSTVSNLNVGIALRYSLPIFFGKTQPADGNLQWAVTQRDGRTFVTATNNGSRRVRLTGLQLQDRAGRTLSLGQGLTGYVLGRSRATWSVKGQFNNTGRSRVAITAQTENGRIQSEATLQTAQ